MSHEKIRKRVTFSKALDILETTLSNPQTCVIGERTKYPGDGKLFKKWGRLEDEAFMYLWRLKRLADRADELARVGANTRDK